MLSFSVISVLNFGHDMEGLRRSDGRRLDVTTTALEATRTSADRSYRGSLVLALVSASSFGLSGSLARSLLDLGWSPTAVVATRVGGAFLILLLPSLLLLRRIGLPTGRQSVRMLAYGVVAVHSPSSATSARCSTSRSASPCCWSTWLRSS